MSNDNTVDELMRIDHIPPSERLFDNKLHPICEITTRNNEIVNIAPLNLGFFFVILGKIFVWVLILEDVH